MLLITHINLNDAINTRMTSLTNFLVFFFRVAFSAQVTVLAWLEYDATRFVFAICASVTLNVNLINTFSCKRWCSWNSVFFILLGKSTAPKRSDALSDA